MVSWIVRQVVKSHPNINLVQNEDVSTTRCVHMITEDEAYNVN